MNNKLALPALLMGTMGLLVGSPYLPNSNANNSQFRPQHPLTTCQPHSHPTNFLVMAGGGNRNMNEIALEKNVLYFQRTLKQLGFDPATANILFANGTDGRATVRYLDAKGRQRFKVPNIPDLDGASTLGNFNRWIGQLKDQRPRNPLFFYFTGHGLPNQAFLWRNQTLTVKKLARQLDRLPPTMPVVTMMAQCFAGSFANFIYEDGNPEQPVALQTRCGFFATIATRTSVGCTPEVNEADYKDYSSSFFAGMSGYSRTGMKVASADYNQDGTISFAEAHAFAKVDEQTTDLPISTAEVWLQKQLSKRQQAQVLVQPMTTLLTQARPEQRYVVAGLADRLNFDVRQSFASHARSWLAANRRGEFTDVEAAYFNRLRMELLNIGGEQQVRVSQEPEAIALLDRLLACEASSWERKSSELGGRGSALS